MRRPIFLIIIISYGFYKIGYIECEKDLKATELFNK